MEKADKIIDLLSTSYSQFHAVDNLKGELKAAGFEEIEESRPFDLKAGGRYFLTRNLSSIIAFKIPKKKGPLSFKIAATHNDSPTFKLKPNPIMIKGDIISLDVEPYGGAIYPTWLDRPLSLAGRLIIEKDGKIDSVLLSIDEDLLAIPNLCIHMQRDINNGHEYNAARDMIPILGVGDSFDFAAYLLDKAGIKEAKLLGFDLFLYNRDKPRKLGVHQEFLSSPRLDDLASAYTVGEGFIEAEPSKMVDVFVSFDNEEVGSLTRQGAHSDLLHNTLKRIASSLGDDFEESLARSYLLSVDNAHANHPNFPAISDPTTKVELNGGVVIKYNADQRYTSDALSASIVKKIAENASISIQEYTNRSDLRGGSTLGNISNAEVSLLSSDIGIAQLAMHSANEICGVHDLETMQDFAKNYFQSNIDIKEGSIKIK